MNRLHLMTSPVVAIFLFVVAFSAQAQYSVVPDVFGTESKTAPQPGILWESSRPLPMVPKPESTGQWNSSTPVSLPELTEFALRNNPRTRQAWLAARAAAANVAIEQADLLPQITANYGATRTLPVSATSGAASPWLTRWGPSVSLSYVLFDFGARSSQIETAEYRLLAANLAHNRVMQDIVFQVEQAYYQLIGLDALNGANEQSLKNTRTALDAAQRRKESGLATVADVYRVETQVAQAQLNLTRSRGTFDRVRGQLAGAVGLPVNTTLKVRALEAPSQLKEITTSAADLLERAKAGRPDLIAAEAQARAARSNASAVARAGLPTIELSGTAGHNIFSNNQPTVNNYSVAVNLRIPLFTGFRDTYSVRQAEALAAQAEAARDSLSQQTELEVWQSFYDLQIATRAIDSTVAQIKSAEQSAQAVLARYQSGFGSILDLITAQQDESNARVQQIQSYLDWYVALARLNFSMGAGDILATTGGKKK
jgi:outer membrane protein